MVNRRNHLPYFLIGTLSGCIVTLITTTHFIRIGRVPNSEGFRLPNGEQVKEEEAQKLIDNTDDEHVDDDDDEEHEFAPLSFHKHNDESPLSKAVYENVRVYCWIMTSFNNTYSRAIHVNATWGPKCNKLVFMTSDEKSGLPVVDLNITEGRKYLWLKTKEAFKYIYNNELKNFDWFLKADDDTFVIVENLRYMLLAYSPDDPIYFGCRFKMFSKQGYMSGGAGYVLSREAVKRFVEDALTDPHKCKESDFGAEDAEMGKCLQNVGVIAGDSRDAKGRHRMLPFGPGTHLHVNKTLPKWFYDYMYYPYSQGQECCSDYMVSYHYVNVATMYTLDYLVYHLRPYGLLIGDNIKEGDQRLGGKTLFEYAKQNAISNSKPADPPAVIEEAEAVELKEKEQKSG